MVSFKEKYIYKLEGKIEYLQSEVDLHESMVISLKNQLITDKFSVEENGFSKEDARKACECAKADFEKRLDDLRFHLNIYKGMMETELKTREDNNATSN